MKKTRVPGWAEAVCEVMRPPGKEDKNDHTPRAKRRARKGAKKESEDKHEPPRP